MSSNRLIQLLREKFANPDIAAHCRETSMHKICKMDFSRIFDDFPDLLAKNDVRINQLSAQLNTIYIQLYQNQCDTKSNYPVESNIQQWLTHIAKMGREELLTDDDEIDPELVRLLKWDNVYHLIDIEQLLRAYISMVLPQIMTASMRTLENFPNDYSAIILSYSSKNAGESIKKALQPDSEEMDIFLLLPLGASAIAVASGLLAWTFFSGRKRGAPRDEIEMEKKEKKAGNY